MWLQGESDVNPSDDPAKMEPQRGGAYYACAIKAMVVDWRAKFKSPLPFLWVQIAPWVGHEATTSSLQLPEIRAAQLAAQDLPLTGLATAVDLGDLDPAKNPWGGVHFLHKQPLGPRLARVAMALVYPAYNFHQNTRAYANMSANAAAAEATDCYRGPLATKVAASTVSSAHGLTTTTVQISFDPDTLCGGLEFVHDKLHLCPFDSQKDPSNYAKCGWYEVETTAGTYTNATATIDPDGNSLTLTATVATANEVTLEKPAAASPGARYLWADWPVATLYNKGGLPALPFSL